MAGYSSTAGGRRMAWQAARSTSWSGIAVSTACTSTCAPRSAVRWTLRDELIREHWDKVSSYAEVPDQPPADPTAALRIWEDTNHHQADPNVGVFSITTAVIAD